MLDAIVKSKSTGDAQISPNSLNRIKTGVASILEGDLLEPVFDSAATAVGSYSVAESKVLDPELSANVPHHHSSDPMDERAKHFLSQGVEQSRSPRTQETSVESQPSADHASQPHQAQANQQAASEALPAAGQHPKGELHLREPNNGQRGPNTQAVASAGNRPAAGQHPKGELHLRVNSDPNGLSSVDIEDIPAAGQHPKGELHLRQTTEGGVGKPRRHRQRSAEMFETEQAAVSAQHREVGVPATSQSATDARGQLPSSTSFVGSTARYPASVGTAGPSANESRSQSHGTARNEVSHADSNDRQYILPLNVVLDRSVRAHIRAQLLLAEKATFDLCVNRLGVICHFQVLSQLMLFGSGMYATEFMDNFVALVSRNNFPYGLQRLHERAVRVSNLDSLKTVGCFSFTFEDSEDLKALRSNNANLLFDPRTKSIRREIPFGSNLLRNTFDALRLTKPVYEFQSHPVLEWFFPDHILRVYGEANRLLGKAQLTDYVLKYVWLHILRQKHHKSSLSHQVHRAGDTARELLRSKDICAFSHELVVFMQLLVAYFKADVVHANWTRFMVRSQRPSAFLHRVSSP